MIPNVKSYVFTANFLDKFCNYYNSYPTFEVDFDNLIQTRLKELKDLSKHGFNRFISGMNKAIKDSDVSAIPHKDASTNPTYILYLEKYFDKMLEIIQLANLADIYNPAIRDNIFLNSYLEDKPDFLKDRPRSVLFRIEETGSIHNLYNSSLIDEDVESFLDTNMCENGCLARLLYDTRMALDSVKDKKDYESILKALRQYGDDYEDKIYDLLDEMDDFEYDDDLFDEIDDFEDDDDYNDEEDFGESNEEDSMNNAFDLPFSNSFNPSAQMLPPPVMSPIKPSWGSMNYGNIPKSDLIHTLEDLVNKLEETDIKIKTPKITSVNFDKSKGLYYINFKSSKKVDGYNIYIYKDKKCKKQIENIQIFDNSRDFAFYKTLKKNKTYYVQISAFKVVNNVYYESDYSKVWKLD